MPSSDLIGKGPSFPGVRGLSLNKHIDVHVSAVPKPEMREEIDSPATDQSRNRGAVRLLSLCHG